MRRAKIDGKYVHPDMLHLNKVNYICNECGGQNIKQKVVIWAEPDDIDDAIDILNKDSEHLYSEEGRNVTYRETLKWEIDEDSLNRKETK